MNGGIIEQNPACHVASPLVRSNHCLHSYYRSGWQPAFAAGCQRITESVSPSDELAGGKGFFHLRLLALHWILDLGSIGGPGAQGQILLGLHLGCSIIRDVGTII